MKPLHNITDRAGGQLNVYAVNKRRVCVEVCRNWNAAEIALTPSQVRALVGTLTDWLSSATPDKEIA